MEDQKWVQRIKAIPWRKIGFGLFVFVLMVLAFLGGHFSIDWYLAAREPGLVEEWKYADWQVYKNETYGFGLRHLKDWEVTEVKPEFVIFKPSSAESSDSVQDREEKKAIKEYVSLTITSNKLRGSTEFTLKGKTLCEEDQSKCSFHTNGIFGERITTPEAEIVFFAYGENDFTLTLHRYDSSDEVWEDYVAIFEEMAGSFRFVNEVTANCEKDADCTLGIRLDKCCSCAEAFTKDAVEASLAITSFEADKDYSGERLVDCSAVYCSPCPDPPSGAICVSSRCRVKE